HGILHVVGCFHPRGSPGTAPPPLGGVVAVPGRNELNDYASNRAVGPSTSPAHPHALLLRALSAQTVAEQSQTTQAGDCQAGGLWNSGSGNIGIAQGSAVLERYFRDIGQGSSKSGQGEYHRVLHDWTRATPAARHRTVACGGIITGTGDPVIEP